MAEAVGLVASVASLIELLTKMAGLVRQGHDNVAKRHPRLLDNVEEMRCTLQDFPEMPPHLFKIVFDELQSLNEDLQSIYNPSTTTCPGCPSMITWMCYAMRGSCIRGKLDEIHDRLQKLENQYLRGALVDIKKHIPATANENIHLPSDTTGLDRASVPLQFIQQNRDGLRIVGIHGQGGIGKTTLLNRIWDEVSSKPPFTARAYVAVGEEATPQSLCVTQSNILQQLGVAGEKKFPSPDFGKGELKKHLLNLKVGTSKAVFLAIDNVWESVDLEDLLPDGLASLLSPSSCIALTSRQSNVIQTLVGLCPFQIGDQSHVLSYAPECLSPQDSQQLFVQNAGMGIEDYPELIHAIVPHCKGLPLALKVLGSLFKSEPQREESNWKEVGAKMHLQEASFPEVGQTVSNTLQLSYDRLQPICQEAFLDVVGFFYGWPWRTVERMVEKVVMCTLKNRSLLTEAKYLSQCNLSAIHYLGYPSEEIEWKHYGVAREVVTMHDLILKFGKCLLEKKDRRLKITQDASGLDYVRRSPYRNRFLWNRTTEREMIQPVDLQGMKNLRFLHLQALSDHNREAERLILNVEIREEQASSLYQEGCTMLRFVDFRNITSNELIMQTMMSQNLRELHLIDCQKIEELPSSSITHLKKLEALRISGCSSFRGLPEHCGNWEALQELFVINCHRITEFPATLGTLPNLRTLFVGNLPLMSLPALYDMKRLTFLEIKDCSKLALVPALPKALKILVLRNCNALEKLPDLECLQKIYLRSCARLQKLPTPISHAIALEILHIQDCSGLLELPEDMGNLKSLKELEISDSFDFKREISDSSQLKRLPESICNIVSLERLNLSGCSGLLELPEDMGNLKSLKRLDISASSQLKRLPESICNIVSLEGLTLSGCSGLLELPEDTGNLKSLKELEISYSVIGNVGCSQLKRLPESICNIVSLEMLVLIGCSGLLELPEDMGNLKSLKWLKIWNSSQLKRLPESICNIVSLERLNLSGCSGLLELPEDTGNLKSLKELEISYSYQLKRLPESICNIVSLERLNLSSGLLELPEDMGNLKSLKWLSVSASSQLKRLPESICNIVSLEMLGLFGCSGLLELPEDMGNLKSLKWLDIYSSQLKRLPESICNIVSIEKLVLSGCSGLLELPEDMGNLKSLKWLGIYDRSQLKRLPESICNIVSLERLHLSGCSGLLELPEDMGNLKSLTWLDISDSSQLKRLPESICNIVSLERLDLSGCSGLLELPEDMGNLKSLKWLDIYNSSQLKGLPESICNIATLESLHIRECSGLLELPEELGNLKSLKELVLCHCLKLEKLPKSICEIMVLKNLDVRRCSSLLELPKEIGKLSCLEKLKVGGCSHLTINLPWLAPEVVVDWNDDYDMKEGFSFATSFKTTKTTFV